MSLKKRQDSICPTPPYIRWNVQFLSYAQVNGSRAGSLDVYLPLFFVRNHTHLCSERGEQVTRGTTYIHKFKSISAIRAIVDDCFDLIL